MNKIVLSKEEQKIYKIISEIYLEKRINEYPFATALKERLILEKLNLIKNSKYFISLNLELYKITGINYKEETIEIIINIFKYLDIKNNDFSLKDIMENFINELKTGKPGYLFIKNLEADISENLQLLYLITMYVKEHITHPNSNSKVINN